MSKQQAGSGGTDTALDSHLSFAFCMFQELWMPWLVPGVQLLSLHLVFVCQQKTRVCAFAWLVVGPTHFLVRERFIDSRSMLVCYLIALLTG